MTAFLAHSPTSPIEKDIDGGGEGALAPAAIRHSFIRSPFVDGLPVRCKEHPLRCKRSGGTSPIEKDIDGGGKGVFSLSTWQSERSERSHVGRVANCL